MTAEFKNEVNAHQYLDTRVKFRGQEIFRSKNGLQIQALNAKTRFTPIFILETNLLFSLSAEGSIDVSESGILINNMALISFAEDIFRLSGRCCMFQCNPFCYPESKTNCINLKTLPSCCMLHLP